MKIGEIIEDYIIEFELQSGNKGITWLPCLRKRQVDFEA
jgi:hypothetical protein